MLARIIRLNPNGKWWLGRSSFTAVDAAPANAAGALVATSQDTANAGAKPAAIASVEAHTFDEGLLAGMQARLRKQAISPYQRVGRDAFALGFRAGYFASGAARSPAAGSPSGCTPV